MSVTQKTKRISIVHVPYRIRGGEERYVESLAQSYEGVGVSVSQWPVPEQPGFASSFQSLTSGHFNEWDKTFADLKPDLLHLNNLHPALGPAFLRWIRDRGIPAIATVHNHRFYCTNGLALYAGKICKACRGSAFPWRPLLFNCNGDWSKSIYHGISLAQLQRENLLSSLKALVAPSDYIARELISSGYPTDLIKVIPHPVSIPEQKATEHSDNSSKLYDCIYAGRFSEEKGIDRLLKVAKSLPGKTFAFAGTGPMEDKISKAAEPGKNVILLGSLAHRDLVRAISASRAACVPSICEESFSLFAVESLLLGIPVVVAPNESLQWLTKLLFPAIPANGETVPDFTSALNQAWVTKYPTEETRAKMRESLALRKHGQALLDLLA